MSVGWRQNLCRFNRNENGTIAILFGLIIFALMGFAGVAMDQARAVSVRTDLQTALDAAALSAAKVKMKDKYADARPTFDKYFEVNWAAKFSSAAADVSEFTAESGEVRVTASTSVPTIFMSILGVAHLDVGAKSIVQYGVGELEIALVLDNTFSMNGPKLVSLKDAATALVDTLKPDGETTETVKVSVVPFGKYVNVGLPNRNQSWISVPDDYSETAAETCSTVTPIISQDCQTQTNTGYSDGVPYTYETQVCENIVYGPPEEQCSTNTTNYVWTGCVGSRNNPLDTQDDSYAGNPIIGLLNTSCPSAIGALSNVKSDVLNMIDGMVATGSTYIPTGLMWGWRSLSQIEPFAEGVSGDEDSVKKALVLMTDGANTKSAVYPKHTGSDVTAADTLTATACNNIKADGVIIFTVTFDVIDDDIKDLMEACASSPANYYDASDSSELMTSFQEIGASLSKLRLAG